MLKKIKNKTYRILRYSEKWTHTDMIYLAKGEFWLTLSQFISSSSGLLLSIAFANLLPQETFGNYKYILSILSMLSIPTLSGMNTAIVQSVARGYEGSVSLALKTKIKWGLLGGMASILLAGYYFYNGNITLTIGFLICGLFIPFKDSVSIYGSIPAGRKLFKLQTKYNTAKNFAYALLMTTALFLTKNILVILFSYLLLNALLNLTLSCLYIKKLKPNKNEDPESISYGKHLSLMNIILTISNNIDKILIFNFMGAAELAIYGFSTIIIDQIRGSLKHLTSLALPKFSLEKKHLIKKELPKKIFKFHIILILIITIYIITAPIIYNLLFPKYTSSIIYSQLLALTLIFFPRTILGTALVALKQKRALYAGKTYFSIIKIILLFILLPKYGIFGIISAIFISNFLSYLLFFYYFKRI